MGPWDSSGTMRDAVNPSCAAVGRNSRWDGIPRGNLIEVAALAVSIGVKEALIYFTTLAAPSAH